MCFFFFSKFLYPPLSIGNDILSDDLIIYKRHLKIENERDIEQSANVLAF